jgi:hypothetical protein
MQENQITKKRYKMTKKEQNKSLNDSANEKATDLSLSELLTEFDKKLQESEKSMAELKAKSVEMVKKLNKEKASNDKALETFKKVKLNKNTVGNFYLLLF